MTAPNPTHRYIALTENETTHHVVVERRDTPTVWQRIATFPQRDRAEDYAEMENTFIEDWAGDGPRYEKTAPNIPAIPESSALHTVTRALRNPPELTALPEHNRPITITAVENQIPPENTNDAPETGKPSDTDAPQRASQGGAATPMAESEPASPAPSLSILPEESPENQGNGQGGKRPGAGRKPGRLILSEKERHDREERVLAIVRDFDQRQVRLTRSLLAIEMGYHSPTPLDPVLHELVKQGHIEVVKDGPFGGIKLSGSATTLYTRTKPPVASAQQSADAVLSAIEKMTTLGLKISVVALVEQTGLKTHYVSEALAILKAQGKVITFNGNAARDGLGGIRLAGESAPAHEAEEEAEPEPEAPPPARPGNTHDPMTPAEFEQRLDACYRAIQWLDGKGWKISYPAVADVMNIPAGSVAPCIRALAERGKITVLKPGKEHAAELTERGGIRLVKTGTAIATSLDTSLDSARSELSPGGAGESRVLHAVAEMYRIQDRPTYAHIAKLCGFALAETVPIIDRLIHQRKLTADVGGLRPYGQPPIPALPKPEPVKGKEVHHRTVYRSEDNASAPAAKQLRGNPALLVKANGADSPAPAHVKSQPDAEAAAIAAYIKKHGVTTEIDWGVHAPIVQAAKDMGRVLWRPVNAKKDDWLLDGWRTTTPKLYVYLNKQLEERGLKPIPMPKGGAAFAAVGRAAQRRNT
jgi:Mn-dependent DtxR family transcriptional regulator